jgi:DNA-binding transcriptional LysR family regulator
MDTADLDLFLAVCRHGGFAAAAKDRDLDPSSVSRVIAALEQELGVRLFQRTTRSLSLTEAGETYRARVEPLLEELTRAGAEAAGASAALTGTLRMTCSVAFGVLKIAPLLPAFRTAYPSLKLECLFTDANLDLIAERVDLAIRLAPAIEGDLIATRLMQTRYHVVASPDYLAGAAPLKTPQHLRDHQCLLLALRPFRTRWIFKNWKNQIEEVPVDGAVTISTPLGVRAAALAGGGPALLSNLLVADDLKSGDLVDVFPTWQATATTFDTGAWAIYPSRAYLPHKVRVMIDFLRAELAKSPLPHPIS